MSRITRRRFVKQSAVAASTVIAAPYVARTQDANSKLGACVVGCGGRGGSHIGAYLGDSRTEITAIVEVDEKKAGERANQIAGKQGFKPKVYADMREAFELPQVDIVSTAVNRAGPSETIPIRDGQLDLSVWQNVFFCEFDGPRRKRTVAVTIMGD